MYMVSLGIPATTPLPASSPVPLKYQVPPLNLRCSLEKISLGPPLNLGNPWILIFFQILRLFC